MIDDKKYWKIFYEKKPELQNCSDFCTFIIDYFKNNTDIKTVLDAGCGNGRDSFVLSKKYSVTGVDNCGYELNNQNTFTYLIDDFVNMNKNNYNLVYSRFTFHSINNEDQENFLKTINPNTYLAIEARSKKGMEEDVYFGKSHYRNYIDLNYFENLLKQNNFEIMFLKEGADMAKYKNENCICIRAICKKL